MGLVVAENITKIYSVVATRVSKDYTTGEIAIRALNEVSFEIEPASFVSFVGPSGSGKTTLLNLIGCLDKPTDGKLEVAGTDVLHLDRKQSAKFRGDNIGFIFQDFNLIPVLTVYENVEYPLVMVHGVDVRDRRKKVTELIEEVGIGAEKNKYPDQLSGGQKQRVAVARALVNRPQLILADEPTGQLDRRHGHLVMEHLEEIAAGSETAIVIVTHDPEIGARCSRVCPMEDGVLQGLR